MKDLQCPVNILAGPGSPPVPELQKLGVARVSLGSAAMRATLGLLRRISEELNSAGTYATLEGGIPFAEVNRMMESLPKPRIKHFAGCWCNRDFAKISRKGQSGPPVFPWEQLSSRCMLPGWGGSGGPEEC